MRLKQLLATNSTDGTDIGPSHLCYLRFLALRRASHSLPVHGLQLVNPREFGVVLALRSDIACSCSLQRNGVYRLWHFGMLNCERVISLTGVFRLDECAVYSGGCTHGVRSGGRRS